MYTNDHRMFMTFHSETQFNPSPSSAPSQPGKERIFPAELLDSGFEWTEILTAESKR
jgi:hypothetical protein